MNKNTTKYQIRNSSEIESTTASFGENFNLSTGGVLNIYGNCTIKEIERVINEKPKSGIKLIQFSRKFNVNINLLKSLNNRILHEFPKCGFRQVFNGHGAFNNLNFLEQMPDLKDLRVELFGEMDLSPINKFCQLNSLSIGGDKSKIENITKNESIEKLHVFEKIKDVHSISKMRNIKHLTIARMTLKNLEFLKDLKKLTELQIILGGTRNLEALPEIGKLEILGLTQIRQLKIDHLEPINKMQFLKKLKFKNQANLTDLNWFKKKQVEVEVVDCKNFKKESTDK